MKGGQLSPIVVFGEGESAVRVKNSCFTGDLYNSYVRHGRKQGVSRKAIETRIGMFLNKMVGSNLVRKRTDVINRDSYYVFPPLKDCRNQFAGKMRNDNLEWDDRQEWDHSAGDLFAFPRAS